MSNLAISPRAERLTGLTLEKLFSIAEQFGRVRIHSSSDAVPPKRYHCTIEFDSIPGTSVTAESGFKMLLADALIQAIDRAERIVESYSGGTKGSVDR